MNSFKFVITDFCIFMNMQIREISAVISIYADKYVLLNYCSLDVKQ